ncbi:uncharacterized protein LOC131227017 [Magnolia sinica]|uniref:uncharacterized protein LOC131227017 n=1 Tax=Magnolia sinica TaxID=86752 RepID=UPI00265813A6|nr:uncharacterized protein LOC131227017 [Magnolia sinica]
MDATLYLAARDGDSGTLIDLANGNLDILRSMAPQGNNILHITASAAIEEDKYIDFVRETMCRCPSLIDQANDHGDTPLHCAARTGKVGIFNLLMGQVDCTSLRRINNMGNTVLIEAITNRRKEVVKKLLEIDHSINDSAQLEEMKVLIRMTDNDSQNALHHAARQNDNESIARQLLDIEPLLAYVLNNDGDSPLHIAATFGSADTFELLVKKSPDAIEQLDQSGRNAFQISAMSGWCDPIAWTWRSSPQLHSAIKEADKKYGNSLLHLAVIHHNIKLAALLVRHEMVDLEMENKDGYTALDLVELRQEDEIQVFGGGSPKLRISCFLIKALKTCKA